MLRYDGLPDDPVDLSLSPSLTITAFIPTGNHTVTASYQIHRFPEDNLVAVPVCETGTFVLSDESPTQFIYLPVVLRSH